MGLQTAPVIQDGSHSRDLSEMWRGSGAALRGYDLSVVQTTLSLLISLPEGPVCSTGVCCFFSLACTAFLAICLLNINHPNDPSAAPQHCCCLQLWLKWFSAFVAVSVEGPRTGRTAAAEQPSSSSQAAHSQAPVLTHRAKRCSVLSGFFDKGMWW